MSTGAVPWGDPGTRGRPVGELVHVCMEQWPVLCLREDVAHIWARGRQCRAHQARGPGSRDLKGSGGRQVAVSLAEAWEEDSPNLGEAPGRALIWTLSGKSQRLW